MQVFHTAGVPPSLGNTILAIIGWTRNSKLALTKSVQAKKKSKGHLGGRRTLEGCLKFGL